MHSNTFFFVVLALGVASVAAAPTPEPTPLSSSSSSSIIPPTAQSTPDCNALKQYCTNCNGNFNCETDPGCEWCYEHDGFGS
ncbi:hypothetical protein F4775DRAFT_591825 [Biscogniauxia sp. FL1348]|nr:hypothetical protein F4775DRAFT_591825 [Biscogniauxia sp. FL1348]